MRVGELRPVFIYERVEGFAMIAGQLLERTAHQTCRRVLKEVIADSALVDLHPEIRGGMNSSSWPVTMINEHPGRCHASGVDNKAKDIQVNSPICEVYSLEIEDHVDSTGGGLGCNQKS